MAGKESRIDLRKKLKSDSKFNPFNDKFDPVHILQCIDNSPADFDRLDLSTVICSFHFNAYYQEFYAYFKEAIHTFGLGVSKLNEFLFATANRDYYLVKRKFLEKQERNKVRATSDLFIESQIKEFGRLDLVAALEGSVDFLNTAINFTRYFTNLPIDQPNLSGTEVVDIVRRIYAASNVFDIIKKSYDSAIWEDGYITASQEGKVLFIKYKNEQYPIILRVGSDRLDSNSQHFYLSSRRRFMSSDASFKSTIDKYLREYNANRYIKSVCLDQGFIKFNLKAGKDNESILRHMSLESRIAAYYLFVEDNPLPYLGNLSLQQLLALYVELQQLLDKVAQIEVPNDEILDPEDFQKFIYRIKVEDLKSYLKLKTVFSESHIDVFLQLLEYAGGRYDLWSKPLVRQDDYYRFLFLPIIDVNILYLVDFWLEQGGYSLDDRGLLFENHVKKTLHFELKRRGITFIIPQSDNFVNKNGNSEQIDLIINLKHTLLIAEVKCIRFPMESRHLHNALKRLEEGSNQVNRKTEFIYRNRECFRDQIGDIEGKDILKVVITNFPIFTGLKIENVPIVDFLLLESYVNTGEISDEQIIFQDGVEQERKKTNVIKFYNDEDEFSKNLRACIECPPVVEKFSHHFTLMNQRMTFEGVEPIIYAQVAESQE